MPTKHNFLIGCCKKNCPTSYYANRNCHLENDTSNNLIVNGNFESGNLAPWRVSGLYTGMGTCPQSNRDWNVFSANSTGCLDVGPPVSGTYAIYNMLDGIQNTTYTLSQNITIPVNFNSAILSWIQAYTTNMHNLPRTLSVDFYNGLSFAGNAYFFTFPTMASTGWHTIENDVFPILNQYRGRELRLQFSIFIPETWTGPGGFVMDDISLIL